MTGGYGDRPSLRDARLSGLEVWLIGTPAELDAAARALAAAGHIAQRGQRRPLTGADAGLARLYLRLNITPARQAGRATRTASGDGGAMLPFPDRLAGGAA
ncbi:hypothetical protein QTQ03_26510 [Micromonospora sp. WMMA1363]|uniref:hypothetical protein n=1 Tax=Micromonospora sp. WMMA1363 TaxID=3053985 RepID=UPI00259D1EE0|nr:hypothetical protein [Micromonospora sp. WMMA1363]MDM4720121.1 hypothetical protein [Micromonospora sp. WMMA1363]MDM4722981.1 hypothetical protein [Micromonospora sp. WMMA1363]